MPLYYVTENVVNTYETVAFDQDDAISRIKSGGYAPADIDTIEWSAELVTPKAESDSLEHMFGNIQSKLDAILVRLDK